MSSEFEAFVAGHPDIAYVDGLFFDLCCVVRGKRYPIGDAETLFAEGMQIPESIALLDVTGDCNDPLGRGFSDGDPDCIAVPIPGTLCPIPWGDVPSAQVMLTLMTQQGEPAMVDPRHILDRVARRLRADGLAATIAVELEFFLIDPERGPGKAPQPPISPVTGRRDTRTQVYGMADLDDFQVFLRAVERACLAQGVPAFTASSEFAPGQFEINLKHVGDPLRAADHALLLRRVVEWVAERHGFEATFMSKPYPDQAGNGMHIHLSLTDEAGRNLFDDGGAQGSDLLRHAIAGMQAAMAESMAIFAPHANAYRRFAPNRYVPVNASWGYNNRSVAFRVPASGGNARRIEHRVPGADANPYLVLAAILAAAHHGVAQRLEPGAAFMGNACETVDRALPWTWRRALEEFGAGSILREYLGAEYVDLYKATKWIEMEKFQAVIAPHEYAWYL
ncbi:glutamine synthetase [Roseospira marina]|uniref:Glutamine synthetase n=1 Tax=Roseospira marina TaxID=140057 RepID=A0A5M6IDP3_9PROT|nr:glutamine synthetase family protein [Roseospira marina]KAA5605845.1 glutamine synthetase [Roseospira marina]MBB4313664.1 glutamine synthetase [Roseospira marina]MBB5086826.1 glutamine synthetase [Roseospira marina]